MPYWNLKGQRESTTLHSEDFKSVIEEYMNVTGSIKQADSGIHGCLTDMIFKNQERDGDIETHIEAKWMKFSLKDKSIRQEFTQYCLLFLRIPEKNRFKFLIFAKSLSSESFHRKIFEKYDETAIEELFDLILSDLEGDDKKILESAGLESFKIFIWAITLIKTDIEALKLAIFQITHDYPLENNIYLRYQNLPDEAPIVNEPDLIYSNLVELSNFKYIWKAESTCKDENALKKQVRYPPPHHFFENCLLSLYPFESYNDLTKIINTQTIERISVQDWARDKDKLNVILALLNKTIKKLCQLRGLFNSQYTDNIFYFPNDDGSGEYSLEWDRYEKQIEKGTYIIHKRHCPGRLIFKKFAELSANPYYLHIGVQIFTVFLENRFFFYFLPRKVFTSDGLEEVPPKRARSLEQSFRDPLMSFNRNLLLEQLFWGYILFLKPELKQVRLIYPDDQTKAISNHVIKILNILGLDNFFVVQNTHRPRMPDDITEEEDPTCLDIIFRQNLGGEDNDN